MPVISRFFGIIIRMYFGDHMPPHFHAEYAEYSALIDIQTMAVIGGQMPPRALGMVIEWGSLHRSELFELWDLAAANQPLHTLPPLE